MNDMKKSDESVRALRSANNGGQPLAESAEQRDSTKENPGGQTTCRTQCRESVLPAADRIRQAAERNRKERLTALLHHISPETLKTAFHALRRDAALGVEGKSWSEYGEGLEENLLDLHRRVHAGTYRALPVRRSTYPSRTAEHDRSGSLRWRTRSSRERWWT